MQWKRSTRAAGVFWCLWLPCVTALIDRQASKHTICTPGAPDLELAHGTTTVAMVIEGGVIAAVDSRASLGAYVGSSSVSKAIPISPTIIGTMAGGAADCSFYLRQLSKQLRCAEPGVTVRTAAALLANSLHAEQNGETSIGTMIMGVSNGVPELFYVDNEGTLVQGDYFAVGSGSPFAYGVLDAEYKANMTAETAAALCRKAVTQATVRDAASGGFVNVYHIDAKGTRQLGRTSQRWTPAATTDGIKETDQR